MTQRIPQFSSQVQLFEGKPSGSFKGIWHMAVDNAAPGVLKFGATGDFKNLNNRMMAFNGGNFSNHIDIFRDTDFNGADIIGVNEINGIIVSEIVEGPSTSVDNTIARYSGTQGNLQANSNIFITDNAGLGINVSVPSGGVSNTLHIMDDPQPNAHYDDIANFILENNDGRLQIISEDTGNQASTIFLTNAPASGDNIHWSIHAQGASRQDRFDIAFQRTSAGGTLDGTAYFTITTDGRTGIGTTNPDGTGKLHIASGSAGAVTANANSILTLERSTTTYLNFLVASGSDSGILFGNAISAQHGGIIYMGTSDRMEFRTGNNITKMNLDSLGDLSIELLDEREGGLKIFDNEAETSQYAHIFYSSGATPVDGQLKFYVDSTLPLMTLDDGQRVGIGLPSPFAADAKLHVHNGSAGSVTSNGSAVITIENNTTAYLQFLTPTANNSGILFGDPVNVAHGGILYFPSTDTMQFRTGQNDTAVWIVDQFVGINDSTPECQLTVVGTDTGVTTTDGVIKSSNASSTTGKMNLNLNFSNDSTLGTTDYQIGFFANEVLVGGIHSEVVYGPFTAGHYSSFPQNAKHGTINYGSASISPFTGSQYVSGSPEIAEGMVVYSTGEMCFSSSISNSLPKVNVVTASADKRVFGVYTGFVTDVFMHCSGTNFFMYQGVGEGGILATDQRGNISAGDLLMSSDRYGHVVKQPDDIIRSYTIAKATEDTDFAPLATSSAYGFKSKLIGCTYFCG